MKKNSSKTPAHNTQTNHAFFLFALKEGKKIKENYLDYSLLLLQVGHTIVIRSPKKKNT